MPATANLVSIGPTAGPRLTGAVSLGIYTDLATLIFCEKTGCSSVPLDQVQLILILVHPVHVLLEIVKTGQIFSLFLQFSEAHW